MKTTLVNKVKLWYYKYRATRALKTSQRFYEKLHQIQLAILLGVNSIKDAPEKMKDLNVKVNKAANHLRTFNYFPDYTDRVLLEGGKPKLTPVEIKPVEKNSVPSPEFEKFANGFNKKPFVPPERKKKKFYYNKKKKKFNNQNKQTVTPNTNTTKNS